MKDYIITENGVKPLNATESQIWFSLNKSQISYKTLAMILYDEYTSTTKNRMDIYVKRLNKKIAPHKIKCYMTRFYKYYKGE